MSEPTWQRMVAHLDMDAFYVSVELRRRPELRGRPVIVAGSGPRAVVTTASYEARRFGVGSAIPASRARRLCPEGVFLTPDFPYYREASRRVMEIVRTNFETVEVVGLDEAYIELTGLPAPRAGMRWLRNQIESTTGLTASVGIGPNKLIAKMASDAEKPAGFVVLTREQAAARFAGAPCGLIPGIGHRTVERLDALGIRTIAQLAAVEPAALAGGGFGGRIPAHLRALARFEHDGAVTEQRKVVSESRETTFDVDIADPARLESELAQLSEQLGAALERQSMNGRTVGIKVRLDDFSTHTRARTLTAPVSGTDQLRTVAVELLRRFDAPRPVRLLGVRVAGLEPVDVDPRQLALSV
jgi:DNA polymerase-4